MIKMVTPLSLHTNCLAVIRTIKQMTPYVPHNNRLTRVLRIIRLAPPPSYTNHFAAVLITKIAIHCHSIPTASQQC
jgi:hypothetical protein